MKRIVTIAICLLAIFGLMSSASAQDHTVQATVPFGFHIGNRWLPAGIYTMSTAWWSPDVILIRSGDYKLALYSLAHPDGQHSTSDKMVFKKYGDQYFLHEVLCPTGRMNVEFPSSRREREARIREARRAGASEVTLALR